MMVFGKFLSVFMGKKCLYTTNIMKETGRVLFAEQKIVSANHMHNNSFRRGG
jgi:hypothetical protein